MQKTQVIAHGHPIYKVPYLTGKAGLGLALIPSLESALLTVIFVGLNCSFLHRHCALHFLPQTTSSMFILRSYDRSL